MFELGCAGGATLAWLKQARGATETVGLEAHGPAADQARGRVDRLIEGNAETLDFAALGLAPGSFDLVLALDVLEHLVDPWSMARRLAALLRPAGTGGAAGGAMIVSLPNVGHFSVAWPLLRHGRWDYVEEGLLDRTHLRFFSQDRAVALLRDAGLAVDTGLHLGLEPGRKTRLADRLTGGRLRHLLSRGFILRGWAGGNPQPASEPGAIRWGYWDGRRA